jgi:hypothetical protein
LDRSTTLTGKMMALMPLTSPLPPVSCPIPPFRLISNPCAQPRPPGRRSSPPAQPPSGSNGSRGSSPAAGGSESHRCHCCRAGEVWTLKARWKAGRGPAGTGMPRSSCPWHTVVAAHHPFTPEFVARAPPLPVIGHGILAGKYLTEYRDSLK